MTEKILTLPFISGEERERRVEELVNETLNELQNPPVKKLSLFGAFKEVWKFWWASKHNDFFDYLFPILWTIVLLVAGFQLLGGNGDGLWGILPTLGPWVVGSLTLMQVNRSKIRDWKKTNNVSVKIVHEKLLEKIQRAALETEKKLVGENSEVGKRLNEQEAKLQRAKSLVRKLEVILEKNPNDLDCKNKHERALKVVNALTADITALRNEQEIALGHLNTVKAYIPLQESVVERAQIDDELRELEGEASISRSVSREVIINALRPLAQEVVPLTIASERVVLLASHAEEGPGAIDRFLRAANTAAEREVSLRRELAFAEEV